MKLTVIGQWGGFPAVNNATSGYLLQHEGFNLLMDCGSAVVSKLQNYICIEDLDAVILSHYHHDHVADIGPLQYAFLIKSKLGLSSTTVNIYGHPFDEQAFKGLTMDQLTKGVAYKENEILDVGPFTITFLKTKHPVTCYAMRIKAGGKEVLYTADGSYTEELVNFSKGADLLVCECNFYRGQDASSPGHMNSTDAANLAGRANVKKLLLTHLPHFGNLNDLVIDAKECFKGEVDLASAGWTWEE